jgi:hypothetical protein
MWDVKNNEKIRVISCITGQDELLNLPSWPPDWRKIENEKPFVHCSGQTVFSTSWNTSVDAWYFDHKKVLNAVGKVVGSIKVVGSEPRYCRATTIS